MEITQTKLKELLRYDSDTGYFFWRVTRSRVKEGMRAGHLHKTGYRRIRVCKKTYDEHRLVFLYMLGSVPRCVDHINQNKSDNRWCNLREATRSQNRCNVGISTKNTSGYKNISWIKSINKWQVQITRKGKRYYIGNYVKKDDAIKAAQEAQKQYHGEFASC